MDLLKWGRSPWGDWVLTHVSWSLFWASLFAGILFFVAHASYMLFSAHRKRSSAETDALEASHKNLPAKIERHGLAARLFHWIMAAAMLTLLVTAFLPKVGVQFNWVPIHWIAGLVLTASIIFHVIHASFFMDFWAIWPNKQDLEEGTNRMKRALGQDAPPPRRFAKYPIENKMYHGIIVLTGLAVILTGVFMIFRVRTGIFPRNPYLFGDMTWGLMYVLHGLAGVGLIALVIVHIYFAMRPEKFVLTKSMAFGTLPKEYYLSHYDTERWVVSESAMSEGAGD